MLILTETASARGNIWNRRFWASMGMAAFLSLSGCDSTEAYLKEQEAAAAALKKKEKKHAEFERVVKAEARAWLTVEPMMREAANYNEDESFGYIGATFVTERFYPDRLRGVVRDYALGPYISISQVFPDTPAARAGLLPGDRLISINGRKMPRWDRAARFASVKVKRLLKADQVNRLVFSRRGETFEVEVPAMRAAYYALVVSPDNFIDMRADGEILWLSLDTVEKITDPDEFAYTCAFILAQNIMRQPEKRRKNAWAGQVLDIAAQTGGIATSGVLGNLSGRMKHWAFTVEADLISLYMLAAAGYDVSKYPDFWRKQMIIAARSTRSGKMDARDYERIEIMNKVIASIEKKQERGAFIFPEEYLAGNTFEIDVINYTNSSP